MRRAWLCFLAGFLAGLLAAWGVYEFWPVPVDAGHTVMASL